jgi:hypothetical protein
MLTIVAIPANKIACPQLPVMTNGIKKLLTVINIRQVIILEIDLD